MLNKITSIYANHGMPLECDIYAQSDYPKDSPVFLYFHPGGLVDWGRDVIAPWLVQVCIQRKWPLISPSYRLLPQTGPNGLLEDVSAAYEFAQKWDAPDGLDRRVIVGGASGGFFAAALIAHHYQPAPAALLSIEGINTFHHKFFNSSTLLVPEPIPDTVMAPFINGPIQVGETPPGTASAFRLDKLLPDGTKNTDYKPPPQAPKTADAAVVEPEYSRGALYDYYTYKNGWLDLVGAVDPGYDWAKELASSAAEARRKKWPYTVIFHGDDDYDVPLDVSEQMRDSLGEDKVSLFVAKDQPHLYELNKFIEDDDAGMEAVRKAVARLDEIVAML